MIDSDTLGTKQCPFGETLGPVHPELWGHHVSSGTRVLVTDPLSSIGLRGGASMNLTC